MCDREVRGNDMKKRKLKRIFSAFLAAALVFTMSDWGVGRAAVVWAGTISGSQNANFDFENGTEGWDNGNSNGFGRWCPVRRQICTSGAEFIHYHDTDRYSPGKLYPVRMGKGNGGTE